MDSCVVAAVVGKREVMEVEVEVIPTRSLVERFVQFFEKLIQVWKTEVFRFQKGGQFHNYHHHQHSGMSASGIMF